MKIKHTADYAALRRAAYPPLATFADALYWNDRGQPAKLQAYYAACDAVKAKFPKQGETLPMTPQRVTRRQARQALLQVGLLDQVQMVLASIPDAAQRQTMTIDWNDAAEFLRTDPTLQALAEALGLSDQALDELFVLAASFTTST
jgi:hypothetical protein